MILAPLAASLVQMAISRSREYEADRAGAEISGNPLWLASALQRLHEGTQAIPNATAEANPATAHLYIDNPLSAGGMASLFSTHPPMEERIARLQAMARRLAAPQPPVRHGGSVPRQLRCRHAVAGRTGAGRFPRHRLYWAMARKSRRVWRAFDARP